MTRSKYRGDPVIHIDAAELGPRNAKKGERMTAGYSWGSMLYEHDGTRWVHIATHHPRAYPTCWTLHPSGVQQADHP